MKVIKRTIIAFAVLMSAGIFANIYGQEVVELKQPTSNKIIVKFMFKVGSSTDTAGRQGLVYTTAQCIAEGGTKDLTNAQIKSKIYPWAAGYFVTVDKEVTIFTFEVPSVFLNDFYPIMKGLFLNPSFSKDDFDRVKANQQNFVDQVIRSSSDEEYSKKATEAFLFHGTGYEHLVQGKSASVKASTLDMVKKCFHDNFLGRNLTIGIAGNYSPEFLSSLVSDMGKLNADATLKPRNFYKPLAPNGINVQIISKENALGSAIYGGFSIPITRKNDDFAAMMVANSYLGEHRKSYSLLYQKIREDRSMNYGDYTYIEWYDNGGSNMLPRPGFPRSFNYASFWLRPVQTAKGLKGQYPELKDIKIGHAHFALRMAIREMDKLIEHGMTQSDFELTRTFLRSYIKLYTQTPEKQLGFLLDSKFYGRNDYISEMDGLLSKLTLDDVNKAIKKYWQTKDMYFTIVTDESEADALAESLKSNTPSPMSYSNTLKEVLSKEILAEDEIVSKYPLNVKFVTVTQSKDSFK
ncbi:MAG: insulinase family protein [Bacteroidota bacterium]